MKYKGWDMITRIVLVLLLIVLTLSLLSGCNTLRGFGQDLKQAGEAIEDAFK